MAGNSTRNRGGTGKRKRRLLLRKAINSRSENANANANGKPSRYRPEWKGPVEGYAVSVIHKNLWRFVGIMSFEDAYQEAYLKFLELSNKYAGTVTNPRWFMSLYKRALANRITDFANKSNRLRRLVCFSELTEADDPIPFEENLAGERHDVDLDFEVLLEEAPEEVRQVLTLLANKDTAMLGVIAQSWQRQGKRKEDGNEFLCKLLGYDYRKVDLLEYTKNYLEGEEDE